ncbi:MAG: endonuclease MutS2 [Candidatus Binataceae bacterium]
MRERDLRALEFDKVIHLTLEHAASQPGRAALAALRPSIDGEQVRVRLRTTAELVELRSHSGSLPIQAFADQRALLLAARREGSVLDGASLVAIRDFVLAARNVAAFLRSRVEARPNVGAIAANLIAPKELADALLGALADDGTLNDDASRELKRLRTRLRDERADLEARLLRSLSQSGMEPFVVDHLVTVRNHRFVLPLKLNYAERLGGIVQDRSVSGETLFVEPMWAVELNNRLMLLASEAEAEERRIFTRLTSMVRSYGVELGLTFEALVKLDALNALAIFAERFGCIEPRIADRGIELVAARHPLLMTSGREVVPIDIAIAPDRGGIVISGPNTGGKTVALKTIGLAALMAQTGMLIPAREGSMLAVFRGIFADIGDEQSIETNLSSFSAHIANLREIIASLAEPALVILDEPGAGTDPVEGAALAIGLMDYLAEHDCVTAIATHSTAVKLHAYSRGVFESAAVDFDAERLAPLYRLKPHTIGQSYGLAIARRLGLPEPIIAAAEAAIGAGAAELSGALAKLEQERARLEAETAAQKVRTLEMIERENAAVVAAERARAKAEDERRRIAAEVNEAIEEMRRKGGELLAEIKSGRKTRADLSALVGDASRRLATIVPAEDGGGATAGALRIGDQVELGDIRGELLELESGRAVIGRGSLRIEVAPERLKRSEQEPSSKQRTSRPEPAITVSVEATDREELNLIGMRPTDALRKLEEFLDQAFLTSRNQVRVVHGVGSGALRRAVHEYLVTSPYCAGFKQAEPQQGGAGATIVELNV